MEILLLHRSIDDIMVEGTVTSWIVAVFYWTIIDLCNCPAVAMHFSFHQCRGSKPLYMNVSLKSIKGAAVYHKWLINSI